MRQQFLFKLLPFYSLFGTIQFSNYYRHISVNANIECVTVITNNQLKMDGEIHERKDGMHYMIRRKIP